MYNLREEMQRPVALIYTGTEGKGLETFQLTLW